MCEAMPQIIVGSRERRIVSSIYGLHISPLRPGRSLRSVISNKTPGSAGRITAVEKKNPYPAFE